MFLNLPFETYILLASLAFSLIACCAVILVFFKLDSFQGEVKNVDKHLTKTVRAKIEKEAAEKLDKILETVSAELGHLLKAQVSKLSDDSSRIIRELADSAGEQQKNLARESQFLVANNLAKAQKDIDLYRESQLAKVDQEINSIVYVAAREILGRAISLSEHEDLVHKALERAKRDKFFT